MRVLRRAAAGARLERRDRRAILERERDVARRARALDRRSFVRPSARASQPWTRRRGSRAPLGTKRRDRSTCGRRSPHAGCARAVEESVDGQTAHAPLRRPMTCSFRRRSKKGPYQRYHESSALTPSPALSSAQRTHGDEIRIRSDRKNGVRRVRGRWGNWRGSPDRHVGSLNLAPFIVPRFDRLDTSGGVRRGPRARS
jgi:hypothetical protein